MPPMNRSQSAPPPQVIADTDSLAALCARLAAQPYVAVDTEFMREKTYWPILCLVQLAGPDGGDENVAAVDPLAKGLDLSPLFDLMADESVVKVFHAARQDVEIFHHLTGRVPEPLFDTQVAAMVCGFGDQVGYQTLASKIASARIDKAMRFADWAKRPLSDRMIDYALADVTHLRPVYESLRGRLIETGRGPWLDEEMGILTDPATYEQVPDDAWQRIKSRSRDRRFLAVLRAVAGWREREAQRRDLPRNRVVGDDSLLDLAGRRPTTTEALKEIRRIGGVAGRPEAQSLLDAISVAIALPDGDLPKLPKRREPPRGIGPVMDLLKVLLKLASEHHEVAPRLIATTDDLEQIAADDNADVPALHGWRRDIFGAEALALKRGEMALACGPDGLKVVKI